MLKYLAGTVEILKRISTGCPTYCCRNKIRIQLYLTISSRPRSLSEKRIQIPRDTVHFLLLFFQSCSEVCLKYRLRGFTGKLLSNRQAARPYQNSGRIAIYPIKYERQHSFQYPVVNILVGSRRSIIAEKSDEMLPRTTNDNSWYRRRSVYIIARHANRTKSSFHSLSLVSRDNTGIVVFFQTFAISCTLFCFSISERHNGVHLRISS